MIYLFGVQKPGPLKQDFPFECPEGAIENRTEIIEKQSLPIGSIFLDKGRGKLWELAGASWLTFLGVDILIWFVYYKNYAFFIENKL